MGNFIKLGFTSTDFSAPTIVLPYAADSFNRADRDALGFTEVGNYEWKRSAFQATRIVNNMAELKNVSGSLVSTDRIDDGRTDGVLSVTLMGKPATGLAGLVFRGTTGTAAEFGFWATPTAYEVKNKTGGDQYATTAYALNSPPAPQVGDVLSVVLNGSTFTVRVNGVDLGTFTDATYTGTLKGLFVRSGTALFDDFRWEPLP